MTKHPLHQKQSQNPEKPPHPQNQVVKEEIKAQLENTPKNFGDIFIKEILARAQSIDESLFQMKNQIVQMIEAKSESLNERIPEELRQKMCEKVNDGKEPKEFTCKYCLKSFKDGRQLGGHTSRAHPELKRGQKKLVIKKKKKIHKGARPKHRLIKKSSDSDYLKEEPKHESLKSENEMEEQDMEQEFFSKDAFPEEDKQIFEEND